MIVIVIPAKGDSSRLPNKNMHDLNGRPMIDYAILEARQSNRADAIFVSTDSDKIAEHAAALGVTVIRRPTSLGGEVPLFDVYRHAAEHIGLNKIDVMIGLQADHPDRIMNVDSALAIFEEKVADYMTSTEADGTVNGAYKMYTRKMLETNDPQKHIVIIDDCTNVHYAEDLARAAELLRTRKRP